MEARTIFNSKQSYQLPKYVVFVDWIADELSAYRAPPAASAKFACMATWSWAVSDAHSTQATVPPLADASLPLNTVPLPMVMEAWSAP